MKGSFEVTQSDLKHHKCRTAPRAVNNINYDLMKRRFQNEEYTYNTNNK